MMNLSAGAAGASGRWTFANLLSATCIAHDIRPWLNAHSCQGIVSQFQNAGQRADIAAGSQGIQPFGKYRLWIGMRFWQQAPLARWPVVIEPLGVIGVGFGKPLQQSAEHWTVASTHDQRANETQ